MSRAGYQKLEAQMMVDKIDLKKQEAIDSGMSEEQASNLSPPSPVARCDSWKRARVNSRGEYVTDESQAIGSKIVSCITYIYVINSESLILYFSIVSKYCFKLRTL